MSTVVPTGGMLIWHQNVEIPSGFLLCNGQAISRTTYANLFSVIGTNYGVGNGSTTFNVPNFNFKAIADNQNINVYNAEGVPVYGWSATSGVRTINFDEWDKDPKLSYSGSIVGGEQPMYFPTKSAGQGTFLYADLLSQIYKILLLFCILIKY
jgi:hypothetical protein